MVCKNTEETAINTNMHCSPVRKELPVNNWRQQSGDQIRPGSESHTRTETDSRPTTQTLQVQNKNLSRTNSPRTQWVQQSDNRHMSCLHLQSRQTWGSEQALEPVPRPQVNTQSVPPRNYPGSLWTPSKAKNGCFWLKRRCWKEFRWSDNSSLGLFIVCKHSQSHGSQHASRGDLDKMDVHVVLKYLFSPYRGRKLF